MRGYCTACGTRVSYYAEQCCECRQREANTWREREKVHLAKQQAKLAALPRAPKSTLEKPRVITVGGIEYDVMGDGTGAWLNEPQITPKNLGSSLLDSSPLRQW